MRARLICKTAYSATGLSVPVTVVAIAAKNSHRGQDKTEVTVELDDGGTRIVELRELVSDALNPFLPTEVRALLEEERIDLASRGFPEAGKEE